MKRLFSNCELIVIREIDNACRDDKNRIVNFVLASKPGDPFWKDVLDDSSNISTKSTESYLDVFDASGPVFATGAFKKRHVTCEIAVFKPDSNLSYIVCTLAQQQSILEKSANIYGNAVGSNVLFDGGRF